MINLNSKVDLDDLLWICKDQYSQFEFKLLEKILMKE